MTLTDGELATILNAVAGYEVAVDGGTLWFERPERWWETPHWRCVNDHVSTMYLKSEERGAQCLAAGCRKPMHLTFPEDVDGPLDVTRRTVTPPRMVCLDGHPLDANGLDPRQPFNRWPQIRPATHDDPQ